MFKKHSVQMKIVKDAPETDHDRVDDFNAMLGNAEIVASRMLKTTTKTVIGVMCTKAAIELTTHIAKTYIK
jgi:hypothetical protein